MKYMTKAEALEQMKQGKKITHEYFLDHEYLYWKNGKVYTEDGYEFDFFFDDTKEYLNNGWSIYEN